MREIRGQFFRMAALSVNPAEYRILTFLIRTAPVAQLLKIPPEDLKNLVHQPVFLSVLIL
jgi:hypothetical protein